MFVFDEPEFNRRLFFPRRAVLPPPDGAEDLMVGVEGDVLIHGRLYPHPAPRAVLLYFHGNGETVEDYDSMSLRFTAMGVSLAVFGYRGYGHSTGEPTLRTAITDAHAILAAVRQRLFPNTALPLILMGRSLGSAPAIELAANASGPAALILESGWADPHGLIARRGYPPGQLSDDELALIGNCHKMRRVTIPVQVLHGRLDDLITPDEAEANFSAAASELKKLCILPGCGHNNISIHPDYFDVLSGFLAEVIGPLPGNRPTN